MLGAPEATALGAMKATFDGSNWKDDVTDLPVLGIYADHSRLGDRDYMKTHYPKLRYVEIPNTGHFLMMEKPDEFNRLVSDFLKEQSF
jgi:sigma-B regulation protein RsbQ